MVDKNGSQERLLPIANVGRIMKQILPPQAKISKEAKETMQECVSEFIGFVTSEASDKCRKERRKTLNGDDVCWALGALGFDDLAGPLRRYLHSYREVEDRPTQQIGVDDHQQLDWIFYIYIYIYPPESWDFSILMVLTLFCDFWQLSIAITQGHSFLRSFVLD